MRRKPGIDKLKLTRIFAASAVVVTVLIFLPCLRPQTVVDAMQRRKQAKSEATPTPTPSPTPTPTPVASPVPAESPVTAVPLAELAIKAIELTLELRSIQEGLGKDATLAKIEDGLNVAGMSAVEVKQEISMMTSQTGGFTEMSDLERSWLLRKGRNADWRKTLAERTRTTLDGIQKLLKRRQEWQATLLQARQAGVTEQVSPRVEAAIREIEDTGKRLSDQLNYLLGLQDKLSADDVVVLDVLDTIDKEQASRRRHLWSRDSPPLWNIRASMDAGRSSPELVGGVVDYNLSRARAFVVERAFGLTICVIVFLVVFSVALKLRRQAVAKARESDEEVTVANFVSRPVAVAFLVSFLAVLPVSGGAPVLVREILLLGLVVPALLLLPKRLSRKFRYALYLLVGYLGVTALLDGLDINIFFKRILLIGLNLGAIGGFLFLLRRFEMNRSEQEPKPLQDHSDTWLVWGMRLALVFATASLVTNVLGYFRLSIIVKSVPALSAVFGAALYTGYLAVSSLIDQYIESRSRDVIPSAYSHQEVVMRWVRRVIAGLFWVIWLSGTLSFFSVAEDFWVAVLGLLDIKLTFGSATISIGNIITFVALILVGVSIASMIRFLMRVEILERLNLKKGIPYAISTLAYYVMLVLVFSFALAAAGVELSKLTLLTGAFGIGAGFGLQNVINNFVSGLILLFERPLRIGDLLEVATTKGKVERIGMRSTSIRTPEGAEVIVPNSNLIAQQVVNWTLTRPIKRLHIILRVVPGTDPTTVIQLLRDCARSHPDVLKEPAPAAFFSQFGRGSLDFELQFWILQASGDERVRSDLGMNIDARLKEQGIALPDFRENVILQASEHDLSVSRPV